MLDKKLLTLLPESLKWIKITILANWFNLLTSISITWVIAMAIDLNINLTKGDFIKFASILAVALTIKIISILFANRFSYKASRNLKLRLRTALFEKLMQLEKYSKRNVSRVSISQVGSEGIENLEVYLGSYVPQLFYSLIAPFTLFVFLAFLNFKIALVLLICVPLIPLSIVAVNTIAGKILKKYMGIYMGLGDNFLDNLQGLLTAKLYRADDFKNRQINEDAEKFRKITMRVLTMQLNSISIMDILAYGGAAIGILLTILEFQAGNLELWQAVFFILLSAEFFIPLRILGSFFHVAMTSKSASDIVFNFLETPIDEKQTQRITFAQTQKLFTQAVKIEVKNLDFAYIEKRLALEQVNLEIPPRSLTIIVGESGSGKSTLAGIIAQKHKDYSGSILVNGAELSSLNLEAFFAQVCLVSHFNFIFKGTIAENLRMAKADATDADLLEVLEKVNLKTFVDANGGLAMELKSKATNLSGGQAQRLALARGLLLDAQVYIFDEATSNIDVESEAIFMELIQKLKREKTILMITHRLANAEQADKIWVFEQGKLVESGTHKELLGKKTYAKLYKEQKNLEELRGDANAS